MGFASRPWYACSRHDLCTGITTSTRTDHGTSGYVPTNQPGVAPVFAIHIQHLGIWHQGRDEEATERMGAHWA